MEDSDPHDSDRGQGLFNEWNRQYLLGESDIEPKTQRERNTRAAIRSRLQQGILDFTLIDRYLSKRDLELVADHLTADGRHGDRSVMSASGGVHRSVVDALTVLCRIHPDLEAVENTLGEAAGRVLRERRGGSWSVTVDIDAERTKSDSEIAEHLEAGDYDSLTGKEAKKALEQIHQNDAETQPDAEAKPAGGQ